MSQIELLDSSEFHKPKLPSIPKEEPKEDPLKSLDMFIVGRYVLYVVVWFGLLKYAHQYHLGHIYVFATGLLLILTNLGTRQKGELSAYSVFNEGFKKLAGTLDTNQIDNRIRHRADRAAERQGNLVGLRDEDDGDDVDGDGNEKGPIQSTQLNKISKMSNQPCYCGSGKKFKKCCYWKELKQKQAPKQM